MKKFEGILLCTDLDGTALKNDRSLPKENIEAIEYFKNEGGLFTFITGRTPCTVTEIRKIIRPNIPFGCINGGGLYDWENEKYIYMKSLPESATKIVEAVEKKLPGVGFQYNMADRIIFCRENSAMATFREITDTENITADYRTIKEPIAKVVFGTDDESEMDELIALINSMPESAEVAPMRSERSYYGIMPKGVGKSLALEKLTEYLGSRVKHTVAVGDYNNDISMIRCADVGIAVQNAVDELKNAADYITVSNEENAIARIICDIEEGKIKL